MIDNLNKDILQARKNKDTLRVSVLSMLKSELESNLKSKKPVADLNVARSYLKKLKKSLDLFAEPEKRAQLGKEIEIIESVLPKELSDKEVVSMVDMCFNSHGYDGLTAGEIIGKLKAAINTSNVKLIADEVKKRLA